MHRREVLKLTALLTGGTLAAPLVASLSSCESKPSISTDLQFFTTKHFELVKAISDTFLPEGDMPGAVSLKVPEMIDHMVAVTYSQPDQEAYQSNFNVLYRLLQDKLKTPFTKMKVTERRDMLLNNELQSNDAIRHLRQQCIANYLATETINTDYLNHLPIPGEYKACIELSEV